MIEPIISVVEKEKPQERNSPLSFEVVDFGKMSTIEKANKMESLRKGRDFIVLDIGPGGERTNISIGQKKNDLWIGVDQAIDPNKINFRDGLVKIDVEAKRVIVPGYVDELPDIKVDLIMMVAPNPQNIVEDGLLEEVGRFCKRGTQVFILLDKRTKESQSYGKSALKNISRFLEINNFDPDDLQIGERKIDTSTSMDAIGGRVVTARKFR